MLGSELVGTLLGLRKHLSGHPLNRGKVRQGMMRFVRYQVAWRATGAATLINWVGGTRLIVGAGMRGVTGEVYMGVNEYADVMFCAHFLRAGDLFVDCGANVGSYSVMAAKVTGAHALAIEPILATIPQLEDHIRLNRVDDLIEISTMGVSDKPGELWFTGDADALNHVTDGPGGNAVRIAVETLDAVVGDRTPICLKIDVESHEPAVVAGAGHTLSRPTLQAVLIETALEHRTDALLATFAGYGLHPHTYDPMTRSLTRSEGFHWHNTLFVRDTTFVAERVRTAPGVKVGDQTI
jgi:FkbM family methyltransferase